MSTAPSLVSGEGVAFDLNHAGVGSRTLAAFVDVVLQGLLFIGLVLLDNAVSGSPDPAAALAVLIVELVLVAAGYPILSEWLAHGRTVGKAWLGLRVVRDDGGPIGFRQALVRGLAGLVIEKPGVIFPFTTAAGVLTMLFSARNKRIGDMLAGTIVVNERGGPRQALVSQEFSVPMHLQPWAATLDLSRLDDQLALGVRQFVVRAHQMTPAAQQSLGADLRARVEAVTTPPPPMGTPTPWVLVSVLAERRRRAELAVRPSVPTTAAPAYWPQPGAPAAMPPPNQQPQAQPQPPAVPPQSQQPPPIEQPQAQPQPPAVPPPPPPLPPPASGPFAPPS